MFKTCPSRLHKRLSKTIKTLKQKAQNYYPNHSELLSKQLTALNQKLHNS